MTETATVTLSESAARRIKEIVSAEQGKSALRVSVEGGGCSGFSYKFDLDNEPGEDDIVLERDDARVLIDQVSFGLYGGLGDRFCRQPDGPGLPDQEPERRRVLRLRHQFLGLNSPFAKPDNLKGSQP